MEGWFDGLFHGAAEIAGRVESGEPAKPDAEGVGRNDRPDGGEPGRESYLTGFRQGVLDARAVANLRRANVFKTDDRAWSHGSLDPASRDPRT
jgi:hypothetical protein